MSRAILACGTVADLAIGGVSLCSGTGLGFFVASTVLTVVSPLVFILARTAAASFELPEVMTLEHRINNAEGQ